MSPERGGGSGKGAPTTPPHAQTCFLPPKWSTKVPRMCCLLRVVLSRTVALRTIPRDRLSCRQTAVGCPPTAVGYPPTAVGYPSTVELGLTDASRVFCFSHFALRSSDPLPIPWRRGSLPQGWLVTGVPCFALS